MAKSKTETPEEKTARTAADGIFAEEVKQQLTQVKDTWTADQTEEVVRRFIRNQDGTRKKLPDDEDEILRLVCNPTIQLQMAILAKVLLRNGIELNKFELAHIRRVMNPQLFRGELVEAGKITLQEKPKKAKLDELLGGSAAAAA